MSAWLVRRLELGSTLGTVIEMSDAAGHLQGDVIGKPYGPRVLVDAWTARAVSDVDLRCLIPDAWTRSGNDRPEQAIGTQRWVAMFRAAEFVSQPTNLIAPVKALDVYRGAPEQRSRGTASSIAILTPEELTRPVFPTGAGSSPLRASERVRVPIQNRIRAGDQR
jgi:hypothetical protein